MIRDEHEPWLSSSAWVSMVPPQVLHTVGTTCLPLYPIHVRKGWGANRRETGRRLCPSRKHFASPLRVMIPKGTCALDPAQPTYAYSTSRIQKQHPGSYRRFLSALQNVCNTAMSSASEFLTQSGVICTLGRR